MKKNTRIILALDETDEKKAKKIVNDVMEYVDAVKINWPLVMNAGMHMINDISDDIDVICDFKVADIPNTVDLIVKNVVSRGASGVIVHAFTGEDSLNAAINAASNIDVFAVTEMSHPGGKMFTSLHAEEMTKLGVKCGVTGFIAPATRPDRIKEIRKIAKDKLILSPGVGTQGGSATSTIQAGADYAIVGRTIYQAENPKIIAKNIADEIKIALKNKI